MIKINRIEPQSASWDNWKARCIAKAVETIGQFNSGGRPKVTSLYKQQKSAIARMFSGKCAFCEKKILSTQHGDIDHFRPKDAVAEEDWSRVLYQRNGRNGEHRGYYWLAYEPNNLILCCVSCNQVAARREWGKGIRFPVIAYRAEVPGEESQEDAKLLDPCNDEPERHITVDHTGIFSVVENSEKGRATIEILGLNKRGLPEERSAKYQAILDKINALLVQRNALGLQETMTRLGSILNNSEELAAVARAAAKQSISELTTLMSALRANNA